MLQVSELERSGGHFQNMGPFREHLDATDPDTFHADRSPEICEMCTCHIEQLFMS